MPDLKAPGSDVRAVDVDDPDAVRLTAAYFAEIQVRFGAFEQPSRDAIRADASGGLVLLAYDAGVAVACGSLRRLDAGTAEVKRMFVAPEARNRGHARALLDALEDAARAMGCTRVVLDTAAVLKEAASLYLRQGYEEIARYNDNPHASHWFQKRIGPR